MTRTLGLIGTDMIGGTLARLAVAAGLDVVLSNSRGTDTSTASSPNSAHEPAPRPRPKPPEPVTVS